MLRVEEFAIDDSRLKRRTFVGMAAGVGVVHAADANSRLNIGLIGTGGRMRDHINELGKLRVGENLTVTAICDVYKPNREAAATRVAKEYGAKPRTTTRYQELLSWKDVDAVVIATPDFSHPIILEAAGQLRHEPDHRQCAEDLRRGIARSKSHCG